MELNQFKLDYEKLNKYINSIDKMHIVIDFSTVMRSNAAELFHHLRGLSRSRCCFYVSKYFDKQVTQLIDDKESGFCSEMILNSIIPAWEEYSCLNLYTIDEKMSSYDFFVRLYQKGHTSCFLTGNETETWKHILGAIRGNVLLVTDVGSFFFIESSFDYLKKGFGCIEKNMDREIHDDGSSGKCETSTVEKTFLFFNRRHTLHYTEILSENGAEGIVYKTDEPEVAVKAFNKSVSEQKIKKLEHLIGIEEKKENFAWPLEFVYSTNHNYPEPIGFTMPLFTDVRPLEEIQYLDVVTNRIRWKIGISFLASVLYLYLHGIQIGDYNFNNFGITDDCKVVFMDVDSYIYGIYGTQMHGRQQLPFVPDYTNRASVIQADYFLLNSMVFWILSDGIWPYYYDEDSGRTVCRIKISSAKEFHNIMKQFPTKLREYFKDLFEKGRCEDPFELLFIMLDSEKDFV